MKFECKYYRMYKDVTKLQTLLGHLGQRSSQEDAQTIPAFQHSRQIFHLETGHVLSHGLVEYIENVVSASN